MANGAEKGLQRVAPVSVEAQQVVLDIQGPAHKPLLFLLLRQLLPASILQITGQRSTTVLVY